MKSPAPSRPWIETAGILGVLLLVVGVPLSGVYETWSQVRAMKTAWNIAGPPCPVTEAPSSDWIERRPLKTFQYGDVGFSRRFGHVSCVAPPEGSFMPKEFYRVCQFSAPALVGVTAGGRTVFFKPGVGKRATVTVRNGQASCVIGGWFSH